MGKSISQLAKEFDTAYNDYLHAFNDYVEQYGTWAENGDKNALKKARQLQKPVPAALDKVLAALKAYGTALNDLAKKKAKVFKKSPDLLAQHTKISDRVNEQAAVIGAVRDWFNATVKAMPKK